MFLGGTMAEGWACYATDLMDEVGFFTPEESLAQQHTRARLLARAVVDIGLHDGHAQLRRCGRALSRSRRHVAGRGARRDVQELDVSRHRAHVLARHRGAASRSAASASGAKARRSRSRGFHDRVLAFGSIPVPLDRGADVVRAQLTQTSLRCSLDLAVRWPLALILVTPDLRVGLRTAHRRRRHPRTIC